MPDLDLSLLASTPVPPLASVDAVRARGDQRRRGAHALVAASVALVVTLGAGTAVTLAGGRDSDTLVPTAPTPTTGPAPATPSAYLLTPGDASRVTGGTWDPGIPVSDQGLLLWVCPSGEGYRAAGVSRVMERDGEGFSNFVSVLPAGEARTWVETFRDAVARCPHRAADSADGRASNSFRPLSSAGLRDALVLEDTYRDCDTCRASVTLWLVVASDHVLSVLSLEQEETRRVDDWVEVVRARLAQPVADAPAPTPTPTREQPVTDNPLQPTDLLEVDRIGPVIVGMTLDEARAAAQQELRQEGDDFGRCVYYSPRSDEPRVSFMVINGVVSRIDVSEGTTTTNDGIGIGTTESDVKRTHPDTVVTKHHYTDGHYLRVLSEDGRHAYVFETDGTKVLRFRSGFPSAVDKVEGCV